MASDDPSIPEPARPQPGDYGFDLTRALDAVVGVSTRIPDDAFTATTLGTERAGHGIVIGENLVVTIGYLVTEAEAVFLRTSDGRIVPGHVVAVDFETGFGLVMALGALDLPMLEIGQSSDASVGADVVIAGAGGRDKALAGRVVARQPFAGYWEYLLDDAIFTAPGHPYWGGTALIGPSGDLIGVGSLQVATPGQRGHPVPINMMVPTDLLRPILKDLVRFGRADRPSRPWLGLYTSDGAKGLTVMSTAPRGPAAAAGIEDGDVIVAVGDAAVDELTAFYRRLWAMGRAGVSVPLTILRQGRRMSLTVKSGAREAFLKGPRLH